MVTEAQEQAIVVEWCEWKKIPVFHVPNGGYRHKHTAAQLKAQGVRRGVPDLVVPLARNGFHGLFIEMKRCDGGALSKEQAEWLRMLRDEGYMAEVCHGAEQAIELLERYVA